MSENKKGPGSSIANSQGINKSPRKLYHERNEESKMQAEELRERLITIRQHLE